MIRSFALAAVAAFALGAGSANAAGMGNWAGFYAGGHIGYGFGADDDVSTTGQAAANVNNVNGGARPANVSLDTDGFVGGAHAGYNWQFDRVVVGVEADIDGSGIDDDRRVVTLPLTGTGTLNNDFEQGLDYLGTLRARLGYAFDNTLFYGTAGLAYGKLDNSANFYGTAGQLQFTGNSDDTEFGYALGAGVEHFINDTWSLTANYLYYDLGDDTVNVAVIPGSGGGGTGYNSKFDNSGHVFRAGASYHF